MKIAAIVFIVVCVSTIDAEDLTVGSSINGQLAYTENVRLHAIPLTTRTKNVFYNDNSTRIIRGIWAVDLDRSTARAIITSGGVGSSFVNVRIRSERGDGLNYQVQIFV